MSSDLQAPWNRAGVGAEPRKGGLSREAIVAAAIVIADAEGLEAVSIRRIATRLEARPMSLYSHIEHKGDLVDLMLDEVMKEALLPEPMPEDWREALRQIAQGTRVTARNHPWMVASEFSKTRLGPNFLRHVDQSLAAVSGLPLPFDRKRAVLLTVDAYTLGFARWEVVSPRSSKCTAREDRAPGKEQIDAYLREQAASGEYPHLAAIAETDLTLGPMPVSFEVGLEWLLAGIAAEAAATDAGGA